MKAEPYTALLLIIFSLSMIAWVYNAPLTILKPKRTTAENFRTGEIEYTNKIYERIDLDRLKALLKHLGAALCMGIVFYVTGSLLFTETNLF